MVIVLTLFVSVAPSQTINASMTEPVLHDIPQIVNQENLLTPQEKTHAYSPFDDINEISDRERAKFIEGVVIYSLKKSEVQLFSVSDSQLNNVLSEIGASDIEEVVLYPDSQVQLLAVDEQEVTYKAKISAGVWEAVDALNEVDGIIYAEPEYTYKTTAVGLPTGTDYSNQWYINQGYTRVTESWALLDAGGTIPGEGSIVAVIDTGVDYAHPDLAPNIWMNSNEIANDGIDNDGNGYVDDVYGWNFIANTNDPMDDHGHGTHVSGIIAMAHNDIGGVGVAYGAKIMSIKAGQATGVFSSTDIAKAINYARMMGADVINMSFGGSSSSYLVEDALQRAFGTCVLVASAGNNGAPTTDAPPNFIDRVDMYPAAYPYVIGVMASDSNNQKAGFSNWDYYRGINAEYEVIAPGDSIYSTLPNNRYASWSGTSMSAPVVSASAAILRSQYDDKATYSSRFIMGQLCAASESQVSYIDKIEVTHDYAALDLYSALTKIPKPEIYFSDVFALDSKKLSSINDEDGIIDAGETINLGIAIRNRWGNAKEITVSIDTLSPGGVPNPYVELLADTITLPNVGTFGQVDNGFVYDDSYLNDLTNPLQIRIKDDCPNDANILINLTVTAKNGWEVTDQTIYSSDDTFTFWVQRGRALKGEIQNCGLIPDEGTTNSFTLTKDYYWIIESGLLIPEGYTLNVGPGTQIQFWSSDYEAAYGGKTLSYIKNSGNLVFSGSILEPIEIFSGKFYENYVVEIQGEGEEKLLFCNILNPLMKIDDCKYVNFRASSNNVFYREYSIYSGYTDRLIGTSVEFDIVENTSFNNLSSKMSSNFRVYSIANTIQFDNSSTNIYGSFTNAVFTGSALFQDKLYGNTFWLASVIPKSLPTFSEIFTYDGASSKYVLLSDALITSRRDYAKALAKSGNGNIWCIDNEIEASGVLKQLVESLGKTDIFVSIGYEYDFEQEKPMWPVESEFTIGNPPDVNYPYMVIGTQYLPGNFATLKVQSYDNSPILLEFPSSLTDSEIDSLISAYDYEAFKKSVYWEYKNNAILNPIVNCNPEEWSTFYAMNYSTTYYNSVDHNYWGTENLDLINLMIVDADDMAGVLSDIIETPILTLNSPSLSDIYPFVTQIWLQDTSGNRVDTVGYEPVEVHVTYNRDMDQTIQPFVSYGPAEPYTDFVVNGDWISAREWVGTATITAFTGDGRQIFRASGGAAADDAWLVPGKDQERFQFQILSTSAESLNLNGESLESGLRLYWNQDEFDTLAGFNLYRSESETSGFAKLNTTLLPGNLREYSDSNVEPGKKYYYYFTVMSTDFTESRASNTIALTAMDSIPPVLSHVPATKVRLGQSLSLTAAVTDNISVSSVRVHYRATGQTNYTILDMTNTSGSQYFASIPANEINALGLEYYIEASDGTSIARYGAADHPVLFQVDASPAVYSVSPYYISINGGITATVSGVNFTNDMELKLGGTSIPYTFVNATSLTFIAPVKAMGRYDLSLSGSQGGATLLNAVSYTDENSEIQVDSAVNICGTTNRIPIYANVSGGIYSAEITLKLDAVLFSSVYFERSPDTSTFSIAYNNLGSGRYKVALASDATITPTGPLAYVVVYSNTVEIDQSTTLLIESAKINGADVSRKINGQVLVKPAFELMGSVYYYSNSATPVANVKVSVQNQPSDTSDSSGLYKISNITSQNITYSASKSGDKGDYAISALDAAWVLQHCVSSRTLTDMQKLAADVDGDTDVDAQDASLILQKSVGKIAGAFPGSGLEWQFVPGITNRTLYSTQTTQNFVAILLGDVTGNWISSDVVETQGFSESGAEDNLNILSESGVISIVLKLENAYGVNLEISVPGVAILPAITLNSVDALKDVTWSADLRNEILYLALSSASPMTYEGKVLDIAVENSYQLVRLLVDEKDIGNVLALSDLAVASVNNQLRVTGQLSRSIASTGNVSVFVASYDVNNRMKGVTTQNIDLTNASSASLNCSLAEVTNGSYLKLFFLTADGELKPMRSTYVWNLGN